ncbi:hypothetical protein K438DRAFT_1907599 [Mycena galopus ATCC 62051]|nr:hypothetical protein K438DRAFT_1907599 [Mycena galopus ATCC 62051]
MPTTPASELLDTFRTHYHRFQTSVTTITQDPTDSVGDIQLEYRDTIDASHNGHPTLIQTVHTGRAGQPAIEIDPDFLRFAYSQRSASSIHHFLGVSQSMVRSALLHHGITELQLDPFPCAPSPTQPATKEDDLLDPVIPMPAELPPEVEGMALISSSTGPLSDISDKDLDILLLCLRSHFRRAGLAILNERVSESLLCIDPIRHIFERIHTRWRVYSVAGSNSLCHHDGQHTGCYLSDCFTLLELRHRLDINNIAHIWLLHFLFLATINNQLALFAQSWNQHRIQIRGGPNRSPADMFVFDMLVHIMYDDELEVYGIDWAGLRDDMLLVSQHVNNSTTKGATPPLTDLSSVVVKPLAGIFEDGEDVGLYQAVVHLLGSAEDQDCIILWTHALAYTHSLRPDIFWFN